jgi:NADH dehydrogenase [ubiquinone] 1 alpha subcomplex assembly factor 7
VSPEPGGLAARLALLIEKNGPISVERYMAEANAHYYATRDPFGVAGDFITAPEISQMFGELIGLWCGDLWARAGRPEMAYVELGPGRGTLAADALRAIRKTGLNPETHLVETSPALREAQATRLPDAHWHGGLANVPTGSPLLVIANEFFDALPIVQHVHGRERMVGYAEGRFVPDVAAPSEVEEKAPAAIAVVRELAQRLVSDGGAALIFDYARSGPGETLQAVSKHAYADPWSDPGERDLTALVDFAALAAVAREEGAVVDGPVPQGLWLQAMGIDVRGKALAAGQPERAGELKAARDRLVEPDQMGRLFQAMAIRAPGWPAPAGFE